MSFYVLIVMLISTTVFTMSFIFN